MKDQEPDHPIPDLTRIDLQGVRKTGGVDLVVVIAHPLQADMHSRLRLTRKIENYISEISSVGYAQNFGVPSQDNTAIVVHIHRDSDPLMLELLEQLRPKVQAAGASLIVHKLKPNP